MSHAKLPLPDLPLDGFPGESGTNVASLGESVLVAMWASWCAPCLKELEGLRRAESRLADAGLRVVLVNVDETPQRALEMPASFRQGAATPDFLDAIDVTQRILTGREREAVLPMSFLVDPRERLLSLYKGEVEVETVLADHAKLGVASDQAFRDLAVPFAGRWLIREMPVDLLSILERLTGLGRTRAAHRYLEKHVTGDRPPKKASQLPSMALSMNSVSKAYAELGRRFAAAKETAHAIHSLVRALQYESRRLEERAHLAILYEQNGELDKAAGQLRQVLALQPSHLPVRNSLAWILATVPRSEWRRPAEAERLAREVCQATRFQSPEPVDTLAAQGKYSEAVEILERAMPLAEKELPPSVVEDLEKRLALYHRGKSYISTLPR